jgi:hypothetical protein
MTQMIPISPHEARNSRGSRLCVRKRRNQLFHRNPQATLLARPPKLLVQFRLSLVSR